MKRFIAYALSVLALTVTLSCSYQELMEAIDIKRPQVRFDAVQLTGLSFDRADLLFTFDVLNPNGLGVSMAGFDYDLKVNTHSFLSGQVEQALKVPANGKGQIRLPLSLNFKDLYALSRDLRAQDSTAYALQCGFSFDLPVLGVVRVPAKHHGHVPNIKLPVIALKELKVKKMSLGGAELALRLSVKNPNAFSLNLKGLDLDFSVNGNALLQSHQSHALVVEEAGQNIVEIPIAMNFLQMGSAVYDMLTGNKSLNYGLKGAADIQSALPLIGRVKLPIDQAGTFKLSR